MYIFGVLCVPTLYMCMFMYVRTYMSMPVCLSVCLSVAAVQSSGE